MTARTVPALLAGLCLLAAASAAGQRLRADFVEPAIPKLAPGQTVTPAVLIHNDSSQSVEFPAVLRVWKADELIYFDSLLIRLLVGDSTYVWFDELACSETLFTGYLFERLMVIFLHGFLTAIAASGLASGWGRAITRLLTAMGLHALANAGIVISHLGWISLAWVQAPLFLAILLSVIYFERLRRRELAHTPSEDSPEKVYF